MEISLQALKRVFTGRGMGAGTTRGAERAPVVTKVDPSWSNSQPTWVTEWGRGMNRNETNDCIADSDKHHTNLVFFQHFCYYTKRLQAKHGRNISVNNVPKH